MADFISQVAEGWERVWHPVRSADVVEARHQLHWATQLVAAVAQVEVTPQDDDAHLSMSWEAEHRRFVGRQTRRGQRVCLVPEEMRLGILVRRGGGDAAEDLELTGRTLEEAASWLAERIAAGGDGGPAALTVPCCEIADHPLGHGARFTAPGAGHAELTSWYAAAAGMLELLRQRHPAASPVRCWPHHFDVASRIALPPATGPGCAQDDGETRSIGVGMTPGDGWSQQPYFYVLPWPAPPRSPRELAGGGTWNTVDWTGAALMAHRLESGPAARQGEQVARFVESAVDACVALLSGG